MTRVRRIGFGALIAVAMAQAVGCGSEDMLVRRHLESNWPASKELVIRGNNATLDSMPKLVSQSSQTTESTESANSTKTAAVSPNNGWKVLPVNRNDVKHDAAASATSTTVVTGFLGKRIRMVPKGDILERVSRELSWIFRKTPNNSSALEVTNRDMLAGRQSAFAQYVSAFSPSAK